jgi:hypothetical protein
VVRDGVGRIVSSTPMMEEAVADSRGTGTLEAIVPARGAASVEVVRDGRVLARRMRSEAPTLRILAPRSGARARSAGTFGVRWQTVDPDSRSLTATVAYSRDDGKTWRTLFVGPDRGMVPLPGSYLAGSRKARLRIEISDGFNQTVAVSDRFTAAGSRPRVQITSPRPRTVIGAGSVLNLRGVVEQPGLPNCRYAMVHRTTGASRKVVIRQPGPTQQRGGCDVVFPQRYNRLPCGKPCHCWQHLHSSILGHITAPIAKTWPDIANNAAWERLSRR